MTSEMQASTSVRVERRQFQRRAIRGVLEIEWGSSTLTCRITDIGPRGLFVEMIPPLWIGARFDAQFMIAPPLRMICTVCRIEPKRGIAVMFDLPDLNGETRLNEFLETLPLL